MSDPGISLWFETPTDLRDDRKAALAFCRWAGTPAVVVACGAIGAGVWAWGGVAWWAAGALAALAAALAASAILRACDRRSFFTCRLTSGRVEFGPDGWDSAYDDVDVVRWGDEDGSSALDVTAGRRSAVILLTDADLREALGVLLERVPQAVIAGEDEGARPPAILTLDPASSAVARARSVTARYGRRLLIRTLLGLAWLLAAAGFGAWLLACLLGWSPAGAPSFKNALQLLVIAGVVTVMGALDFLVAIIHWTLWRSRLADLPPAEPTPVGEELAVREAGGA